MEIQRFPTGEFNAFFHNPLLSAYHPGCAFLKQGLCHFSDLLFQERSSQDDCLCGDDWPFFTTALSTLGEGQGATPLYGFLFVVLYGISVQMLRIFFWSFKPLLAGRNAPFPPKALRLFPRQAFLRVQNVTSLLVLAATFQ